MEVFDLIVIGGGSGLNIASGAAEMGLKTAIIEKGPMGGTCLNRGCIPSKMIIHSADVVETIKNAKTFGITVAIANINFKFITERASKVVDSSARRIERALKGGKNPTLFKGEATFIGERTLTVNGKILKGKNVVIGVGARPLIPPIDGIDDVPYLTSTEALRLTKLPKSMIIIGGGYIGCELGYFYAAMGTKITIIQRRELLLPREDEDIATLFTNYWKKKYTIITNGNAIKVEKKGKNIIVHVKMGNRIKSVEAEHLLVATGVTPNTDTLHLEKTGVTTNDRGYINVNKYLETSAKHIWAFGDVAGIYLFKHSANREAEYVLNNIVGKKKAVDYDPMPHAVFSDPQIAGVGLTEQEAREQKKDYVVGTYEYRRTGMGRALEEKDGFAKFIVDKRNREISLGSILSARTQASLSMKSLSLCDQKRMHWISLGILYIFIPHCRKSSSGQR
jgi:dihydrolipoamide dehydrogenase